MKKFILASIVFVLFAGINVFAQSAEKSCSDKSTTKASTSIEKKICDVPETTKAAEMESTKKEKDVKVIKAVNVETVKEAKKDDGACCSTSGSSAEKTKVSDASLKNE